MFSHRKVAESSGFFCSDIFLGGWLSFEPIFEALIALAVLQRAYRPPFPDPSHSRDRRFDIAGSAFDFGRLSAADRHRSFASVRKMTTEARIQREKQKNWSFWVQTGSLEHWGSRHFGLLSRPGPCGSQGGVLCSACSQAGGLRDDTSLEPRPSSLWSARPSWRNRAKGRNREWIRRVTTVPETVLNTSES